MAIPKNSVIIIFHKEAWSTLLRVDTMDEVKPIRNTEVDPAPVQVYHAGSGRCVDFG